MFSTRIKFEVNKKHSGDTRMILVLGPSRIFFTQKNGLCKSDGILIIPCMFDDQKGIV